MFISEGIVGKRFVVEELMFDEEKGIVFADFPIGATIQDSGKRKRSELVIYLFIVQEIKEKEKEKQNKINKSRIK